MGMVACLSLGYVIGSVNPAAMLAKRKNINLREEGSGNLGATNTMVVMGLRSGVTVMVFDVLKTIFAHRVARWLFPQLYLAGLIAACGTILGHIFPFYLKFQGGKGVACFAGLLMTYDFGLFLVLLGLGVGLVLLFDYGIAAPITAAVLFPLFVLVRTKSLWLFVLTEGVSCLIIGKHHENFQRIKSGEEIRVRAYLGEKLWPKALPPAGHTEDK